MIMELCEYLVGAGWNTDIADEAHDAVVGKSDLLAELSIKHKLQWMDDEEHDYTGNIIDTFREWQLDVGEITQDEYRLRCQVEWPHLPDSWEVSRAEIMAAQKRVTDANTT